jgi:hypothetical protein
MAKQKIALAQLIIIARLLEDNINKKNRCKMRKTKKTPSKEFINGY